MTNPTPTPAEIAKKEFESVLPIIEKVKSRLIILYGRWQDEKEYEDFADYAENMKVHLANVVPDLEFVKATKRPFGFSFTGDALTGIYRVSVTRQHITFKRIK